MKRIVILGSTGSIGKSALDVIRRHRERFKVTGLTAGGNSELLLEQTEEFGPEVVALDDRASAGALRKKTRIPVYEGVEGVCRVASYPQADFVLSAIVGFAGLAPTVAAVRAGKTIGLANKESLVVAGEIVMREARQRNLRILPVDSEHNALFQCLDGKDMADIKRVILTASGGPFAGRRKEELKDASPEEALSHPNWSMGRKITVDSATLMNKGFEVIEAHYLFGLEPERIDVLIHPQSIVHCIVELKDACLIAQMSMPDMRAPIAYALSYPERLPGIIPPLDLASIGSLTFMAPEFQSFPCLGLAYRALGEGGTMPAVLNAANEVAVEAFLQREIGFNDIPAIIKETMDGHRNTVLDGLESVNRADRWARQEARGLVG